MPVLSCNAARHLALHAAARPNSLQCTRVAALVMPSHGRLEYVRLVLCTLTRVWLLSICLQVQRMLMVSSTHSKLLCNMPAPMAFKQLHVKNCLAIQGCWVTLLRTGPPERAHLAGWQLIIEDQL